MKLTIPVSLAALLLLAMFFFVRTDAVSAAPNVSVAPASSPAMLTGTITSTGVITHVNLNGVIVSGSGADLPADIPVTLYGYQATTSTMDLVLTNTTTARSDGSFTFVNVTDPNGMVYLTSANYAGLPYHSSPSMGEPMTITVFDVTTATSHLLADQLHLIFSFANSGEMQVMEVYILTNVGTQTIVGGNGGELNVSFPLPEGAMNPDYRSGLVGEAELETHDGFWETPAVRPGGLYGVSYAFSMPYSGNATINQPLSLPVNGVGALLPDTGNLKIVSDSLDDAGLSDFGGTSYHIYSGNGLPAGAQLAVKVSGNPNGSAADSTQGSISSRLGLIVGLGAFGLVLVLAGVWISRRNRIVVLESEAEEEEEAAPEIEAAPAPLEKEEDEADALMDDIIALDDLYQAGELPEAAYRERRAELKEKLRVVLGDKE